MAMREASESSPAPFSWGSSTASGPDANAEALLFEADKLMYETKAKHKGWRQRVWTCIMSLRPRTGTRPRGRNPDSPR
jgi:hypothetical protein